MRTSLPSLNSSLASPLGVGKYLFAELYSGPHLGVVDRRLWSEHRQRMFRRMLEDIEVGYLDPDIYSILQLLFNRQESFPVSSCSGRITLVDAPMPWHRKGSTVIFKKHSAVERSEVEPLLSQSPLSRFWLVVTGPILHVSALTLREASTLLKIARKAGLKHSGVLSISRRGIYLELRTGVRLTILLKSESYTCEHLAEVVKVANEALAEGKIRLKRLYEELSRSST